MAKKVDVKLISALNAEAEGQKVENLTVTKAGTKCKGMNIDEAKEYIRNWGKDKKGD